MGTTQIVNGILVTFTGDPLKKAIEIVGMFDRLACGLLLMSHRTKANQNRREVKAMSSVVELKAELQRLAGDLSEHANDDAGNLRAVLRYGVTELERLAADLDEAQAGPAGG